MTACVGCVANNETVIATTNSVCVCVCERERERERKSRYLMVCFPSLPRLKHVHLATALQQPHRHSNDKSTFPEIDVGLNGGL